MANKKSPVDPVEVSRIIKTLPKDELNLIKWVFEHNIDDIYCRLKYYSK